MEELEPKEVKKLFFICVKKLTLGQYQQVTLTNCLLIESTNPAKVKAQNYFEKVKRENKLTF